MLQSCWKRPIRSIGICGLVAVILVGILHTLNDTQKTSIKRLLNQVDTFAKYGDLRFGIVDNFTGKIPSDAELASMTATQLEDLYWSYINTIQILGHKILRVGKIEDGGKEVCTDEPFRPGPPCLVYSFGTQANTEALIIP
ncbi:hypothetical protein CHS0354_007093 [Potamilus streckersoni]|uniref:Uncharacterized protein n=1 Tax=Potamilus streckersoni TaxID=2493646 RepID=A0AAE0TCB6_9BIVA|nr:hypothetical protein CHS0354_007093 [Potamilus streckersoni]